MRLISRHILRALGAPFIWGVAALTGLMLLNGLPPIIESFGGKGIPVSVMIEGVLLVVPSLLALTLPMAVLVSVLYGYSQLAANLEMVAMYANGMSVWRMARPALIGGAVVALVNFFVFDQLMPQSNTRLVTLGRAVNQKSPTLALREQVLNVFPPPISTIIRADVIVKESGAMKGVTIIDLRQYDSRRLIRADSGVMAESANGKDLIMTLHSGVIFEVKPYESGKLQQTNFDHTTVQIRDVQNDLTMHARGAGRDPREMTSCELLDGVTERSFEVNRQLAAREYYTRRDLRTMAGLPPVLQPAEQVRPALVHHCGVYLKFERWFKGLILPKSAAAQVPAGPQPPAAQQPAVQQPAAQPPVAQQPFLVPPPVPTQSIPNGMLTDIISVQSADILYTEAHNNMLKYKVEFHQKFAVPLASFCFVLIGMSLALKYPGSGIGLVIGGSLVIFLGFYIMLQGGRGIAVSGRIDPIIAAYTPVLLFTLIGLFSVHSANREMGTARSAGVFESIADIFRRKG